MRKEKTHNSPSKEEEKDELSMPLRRTMKQEPTSATGFSTKEISEKEAAEGIKTSSQNEGKDKNFHFPRKENGENAALCDLAEETGRGKTASEVGNPSAKAEQSKENADEGADVSPSEETKKGTVAEKASGENESSPEAESAVLETAPLKKSVFARLKERVLMWKKVLFDEVDRRSAEIKHAKAKRILVTIGIGIFIVCFVAFYFTVGKQIAFFVRKPEEFRDWLKGFGKSAIFIFIFLRVVQTVFKLIPGEALEIAAGCMFGTWEGLLWCLVGSVIGSLIIIFLGKKYGMKIVGLFVSPEKIQSVSFLKNKKRLNFTFFLLYFIPGTPKDMFTWLVCLTDENPFLFVLITTVARIPSVITSTWCGHALINENYWLSAAIFGATVLLAVIGGLIYKLAISKKKPRAASANESDERDGGEK